MLLAIDIGNSETDVGLWDGESWQSVWRRRTSELGDAAAFGDWLDRQFAEATPRERAVGAAIVSSVVPNATDSVMLAVQALCGVSPARLWSTPDLDIEIRYDPPSSLGADRLANALAARSLFRPVVVVDVGTATTFDAVDRSGAFVGGAIMPGPALAAASLASGVATLPEAPAAFPAKAIGASTLAALQSGIMLGHAAAIQGLATTMVAELGGDAAVIATGGLGDLFCEACPIIRAYYPTLTLDGLVVAHRMLV